MTRVGEYLHGMAGMTRIKQHRSDQTRQIESILRCPILMPHFPGGSRVIVRSDSAPRQRISTIDSTGRIDGHGITLHSHVWGM